MTNDDYIYQYSLALTHQDVSASVYHMTTMVLDSGSLDGQVSQYRLSGSVYFRRKFSVCTTYFDPDCYYAAEASDGLTVMLESISHISQLWYAATTIHTGSVQRVLGVDNTMISSYSVSLIYTLVSTGDVWVVSFKEYPYFADT